MNNVTVKIIDFELSTNRADVKATASIAICVNGVSVMRLQLVSVRQIHGVEEPFVCLPALHAMINGDPYTLPYVLIDNDDLRREIDRVVLERYRIATAVKRLPAEMPKRAS